jgi:Domain of unknown function (DUF5011)
MKSTIIKFFCLLLSIVLLQACSKEPTYDETDDMVGSSKVVYFATVAIKGERLMIIDQGSTFTDPGVTAELNGQPVPAPTSGTVNVNVPGVYVLEYTASNPEGFTASDWRTVVVMSTSAQVTNNNFAGTYVRDNGVKVFWTKTGRGVYTVDNPGGAGVGVGFLVTLVNYEGNKIAIPQQLAFDPSISGLNTVSSASEVYNASAVPVSVKYAFLAGGYGSQVRNFTKQ